MNRYEIRCSEEQTKLAFEIGAPIYVYDKINSDAIRELDVTLKGKVELSNGLYAEIPTAEQMIGWLEEQYGIYDIHLLRTADGEWKYEITTKYIPKNKTYGCCKSRPEATNAAIDAALDFLARNKK